MTASRATGLRWLVIALFTAFWVLTLIADAKNPGYRAYRDFVSSLASFGAESPGLGIAAIACTATAHIVGGFVLMAWDRVVGWAVLAAGLGLALVASFRIHCPTGAAKCLGPREVGYSDAIHAGGVLFYSVALVVAIIAASVHALRVDRLSALGYPGLVAAALFIITLVAQRVPQPGLPQRLWALIGQLWLVGAMAFAAARLEQRREDVKEPRVGKGVVDA